MRGREVKPEFPSLKALFDYCDPDESGNISKEEFTEAWDHLSGLDAQYFRQGNEDFAEGGASSSSRINQTLEEAWDRATQRLGIAEGDMSAGSTHVTFAQFAQWANHAHISLPVGVDIGTDIAQACRFEHDGRRCPCEGFKAVEGSAILCECGHKRSQHFSDVALMTLDEQNVLRRLAAAATAGGGFRRMSTGLAKPRRPGFDMVTDETTLADLQKLLTDTFKPPPDNWTRDRGCSIHGRNACEAACIFKNKLRPPKGYKLMRAEKNRNDALWQTYTVTRSKIKEECKDNPDLQIYQPFSSRCEVRSEKKDIEELDPSINEWRLLHGTGLAACKGICGSNFRTKLAGTGATWKKPGEDKGAPLYGWGIYLAERSTKADEYAEEIKEGLPADIGCHTMLVCRCVGGLVKYVDTNEYDINDLRADVFDGAYHSVFGDRETKLGKPFKEIVAYDQHQIFPEFILYYERED